MHKGEQGEKRRRVPNAGSVALTPSERREMPDPPKGETDLRTLAERYERAESQIREFIALAVKGDKRTLLKAALQTLIVVRKLPARGPVVTAYLAEHPFGTSTAVDDLAGSLAKRLDDAVRRAQAGSRRAFRHATEENLEELSHEAVTAHEQPDGTRWTLGGWATMNTLTLGRQATSRGLTHAVGEGGRVTVHVGECGWCREHAGEGTIGQIALPPYHPSCSCTATAA
jgi:hypothetical protein